MVVLFHVTPQEMNAILQALLFPAPLANGLFSMMLKSFPVSQKLALATMSCLLMENAPMYLIQRPVLCGKDCTLTSGERVGVTARKVGEEGEKGGNVTRSSQEVPVRRT